MFLHYYRKIKQKGKGEKNGRKNGIAGILG
jgi:hypothetical protein